VFGQSQTKSERDVFKAHDHITSVAEIVNVHLVTYGRRAAIRYDDGSEYQSINFLDYQKRVVQMIRYLQAEGAEQKVIATLCKNRIEWDMTALAAFYTANVVFPLDTKFNQTELEHLLGLAKPDYVLLSYGQLARWRDMAARLGLKARVIIADLTTTFEDGGVERQPLAAGETSVQTIVAGFEDAVGEVKESSLLADPRTVLGYYSTSGTVSLPKIVTISHGNIIAEVNCAFDVINLRPKEDLLNIGPYTHIATLVEFLVSKTRGFTVSYFTREPDDDDVLEDEIAKLAKQGVRVKALLAVPKFWVYLVKEVLEEMKNKPVMRKLYEHLVSIEKNETLHDIGTLDKAKLAGARILLRNKLGGHFSYGISSSTKLDGAIVKILGKLGITCIDIYGATECTGIISRNKLNDIVPGSCGKLIDELDFRLADRRILPGSDQEVGILLVKGKTVASNYITREHGIVPVQTTVDDYYVTGDLCWVGDERQVYIVGREKELLTWDDGTLIDPQFVSNLLIRSVFVKDAMVARRNPTDDHLSVFIFPDYKRLEKDPDYKKEVATGLTPQMALKRRCVEAIEYAESIARITPELKKSEVYILPHKLERTPTHKIKFIFELQRTHLAERI
jgi:long-chain acyl-CoA synthetase